MPVSAVYLLPGGRHGCQLAQRACPMPQLLRRAMHQPRGPPAQPFATLRLPSQTERSHIQGLPASAPLLRRRPADAGYRHADGAAAARAPPSLLAAERSEHPGTQVGCLAAAGQVGDDDVVYCLHLPRLVQEP